MAATGIIATCCNTFSNGRAVRYELYALPIPSGPEDRREPPYPGLPIWAVPKLKGQSKRDGSIILRSCKARQSPVYLLVGVELDYGFGGSWGLFPQSIPR